MIARRRVGGLVAFEGIDGAGKSTALDYLRGRLLDEGIDAFVIGGHSWLDPQSTRVLIDMREQRREVDPALVVEASRRDKEGWARYIDACTEAGMAVLADRYVLSDIVLYELLYGCDRRELVRRYAEAKIAWPTAIVLLDVNPSVAFGRIVARQRARRFYETPEFLARAAAAFRDLIVTLADVLPPSYVLDNNDARWRERMDDVAAALLDASRSR